MAQNEWWKQGTSPVEDSAGGDWLSKGATPVEEPKRTRGVFETANDLVIEGANAAAGGVASLASFVRPGNKVSSFIDENIIKAGEAKQSDIARGAKQALSSGIQNADGMLGELGAVGKYVVQNPGLATAQALGSFALPGSFVKGAGKAAQVLGAGAKGAETAGRVGGIAAGAAMAGGDAAGTAYDLSTQAGATDEQGVAAGRQASVIPALVGGVTGAFGAEKLLAGGQGFKGGLVSRAFKTGASEAGQEAIEEGVTQYEGQRAAMPYDASIDPMKGVAGAAGMGAALGGITGAGISLATGNADAPQARQTAPQQEPAPIQPEQPEAVEQAPQMGQPLTDTGAGMLGAATDPLRSVVKPSEAMGIDPSAGAISKVAAMAVDTGVTQQAQAEQMAAQVQDAVIKGEQTKAQPVADQADPFANVAPTPPPAQAEPVPMESRSLDELRQALRNAQDPAIRKVVAAEIRKRREAMPDPLQPVPPQQKEVTVNGTQADQAKQSRPQQPQARAAATQEVSDAKPVIGKSIVESAGILNRGADPLQSFIEGENNARRATDGLRGATGPSTGAGANNTGSSVAGGVASAPSRGNDTATAQPDTRGADSSGGAVATQSADALKSATNSAPKKAQKNEPAKATPQAKKRSAVRGDDAPSVKQAAEPGRGVSESDGGASGERPANWRGNAIKAGKVARSLGLDPKGKRLKEIVAEIDAKDGKAGKPSDESMVASAIKKADELGLKGADRKQWVVDSLSTAFSMTADEVAEIPSVVSALKSRPSKDSKTKASERFVESVVRQAEQSNVQNTPQGTAGKAAPVEAAAPKGGDAAKAAGVPAKAGASDVQADGVNTSKSAPKPDIPERAQKSAESEQVAKPEQDGGDAKQEAEPQDDALNDRNTFTLNRMNRETDQMEPVTFERGEYVRYTISGKELFGDIDGISQAKREFSVDGLWYPMGYAYKAERPAKKEKPTEKLSTVIDKVNAKNGEGLTDADRVPGTPLEEHKRLQERINTGEATVEEYKAGFDSWIANKEAIVSEYMAMKKDDLLAMISGFYRSRYKSETKAATVDALWRDGLQSFTLGRTLQYGMGRGAMEQAVKNIVNATDADQLATHAAEVKAAREERIAQRAKISESVKDPKTPQDLQTLMAVKVRQEGMTFKDARMSLTPEQRAMYDEFIALESREKRKESVDSTKSVRVAGQKVDAQIIATKHTQKGHDLFVVQLAERVSREDYETLNTSAKRMGGYYSSFRGRGAIAGFQFKDKATAEAFVQLANGDSTQAQEAAAARRDAFADDRSQTAVERLNEMADKLEELADNSLNADRKVNTDRRARFAARAEAAANSNKAFAKTMRNIAAAIEGGKVKFLDRVRQKTQVAALFGFVKTAQDAELRAKYPEYADQEKHKGAKPTIETADNAEFPSYSAYRSDLASLGRQLLEVDGTKLLGQKIMKVADDVSDAFNKFAKENTGKLMAFRTKDGGVAGFSSKADAERSIAMSGYRGKALPYMVKRGEYTIILSPSEAIERGIWKGDGDKRITFTPDFGAELVEKIGKAARRGSKVSVPWQFESAHDKLKLLARMGIETPAEFRSALREFIAMQEQDAPPDKVKAMERSMVGRKNDGMDFFPTPQSVADEMVEAAGIEEGMSVLEPSAGWGHIAERIRESGADPDVVELSGDRRELLEAKGFNVVGTDFMDMTGAQYDRIVMNPPFSDRRDAEHVRHAYTLLKPGGRVVAIMGEGVFFGSDKKAQEFREWLESLGATDEKLPAGSFMDPSLPVNTGVNARMVVIEKPLGEAAQDEAANFGTKPQQSQGTPADRAVMAMAGDGKSADEILNFIASASKSPYRRMLAKKLIASGANPAVSIGGAMGGGEGFRFLAKYSRKDHEVTLSEAASDRAEQIFLHETVHAATLMALDKGGLMATQMKRLYEQVKANGAAEGQYGLKNVGEFVAEAFTNPEFQKALKGIKVPGGTVWERFVNMVRRVLGLADTQQDALSKALDLGAEVMRENTAMRKAKSFRAEDGPAFAGGKNTLTADELEAALDAITGNDLEDDQVFSKKYPEADDDSLTYVKKLGASSVGTGGYHVSVKGNGVREAGPHEFFFYNNDDEFIGLARLTKNKDQASINMIAFTEDARGSGFGKAFYKYLLDDLGVSVKSDKEITEGTAAMYKSLANDYATSVDKDGRVVLSSGAFMGVDQTETEAFKKWFAGSKVVDAQGKPLVMLHGTRSEFKEFDPKRSSSGLFGSGFYFTDDRGMAEDYADGGVVMDVYLSIKNPASQDVANEVVDRVGEDDMDGIRAELERLGYDGVMTTEYGETMAVAFRPEQIKSATGNRGTFDPNDPDISHFGVSDAVQQIKQFDVKSAPKNTWAHYRGMAMQALGRRQIVDLYSEELPQLGEYDYLVQKMDAEKNDSGAEADEVARKWAGLNERAMVGTGKLAAAIGPEKYPGMDKKLADLMHDATLAQLDPDKPMPADAVKAQYDRLKTQFNALSPEAKALYRQARDMYADHYTAVQKAIKERIERSEMSAGQKRQIMAQMDEKLFQQLKGVYFPLARFGQYVIVVKDANGEVKNVTRAESVNEAEEARKALMKAYPAHMGNTVGKVLKQAEFNAGRDAVGKGFMADLMGALDKNGVNDELRDTVAQLYLSSLPDLSWAKHGIHRKGTPGFSQDARRAFAQNMFHGARYLAKLRYSDQLQDQLIEMQDHVKAYEGVDEYDSIEAQQVVDEMVKRHDLMMNPNTSPVSTALTSFGFLFHMGLSPASAMVNLTQTALVAFPQMGAKWGFTKASAALLKASDETVRAKNDLLNTLKGEEREALERAIKDGTIDVTMAHDLAGISQGEDQRVMWKLRPVMRAASFMFHHAEKFNRQATFLAAYRLAKEASPEKNFEQLYEEAKRTTYDGHFDYSAGNRPRFMQGNWQKVILLFKSFAQNSIYVLARNAHQSVMAMDPKDRSRARKTLAGILATHAAAAGVLGLPVVGQLLTIASWIGSDDDEPWDAEVAMQNAMAELLGKDAAEVMARGLSRLTPFDISGRVSLNNLILPDVYEGLEGKAWAESAMAAALGPVAGIGVNVARGMQKITDGDYQRGLEDMLPAALRGPMKALRYADEGAVDKSGIVITDNVGLSGIAGQALGLSPSQVRRDTERRGAIYGVDRALLERRSVLMRMFADARMNGDSETVQEIQKEIQQFNAKNPNRRITGQNLVQSINNRRKRIEQAKNGIYLPKNRRDAIDAVDF